MKLKTSELTGRALDYAVLCVELDGISDSTRIGACLNGGYSPSSDWAQCGRLIEEYKISLQHPKHIGCCLAYRTLGISGVDPDPKIAICLALVATLLGDEVEIPDELLEAK